MDLSIPDELRMLRDTVKRFVDEELIPREKEIDVNSRLPEPVVAQLQKKTKDLGLWALSVPEKYGGGGVGVFGVVLVNEELGKTVVETSTYGGGIFGGTPPNILYSGTPEQIEKYLLPIVRGEKQYCFAQTEPNAGSDPGGMMETTAIRDGDNWVINGNKIFISYGSLADFALVIAVTDKVKRAHGGISCFIVEKGTPGFTHARVIETMGDTYPSELVFDNVVVPNSQLLGEVGQGFIMAQQWLGAVRMGFGASMVGVAERALKMAIDYSKQRVTFGRPIAERQAVQWMMADAAVDIHATRMMAWHGAWKVEKGEDVRQEAAMIKLFCTEMVGRVIDSVMQIHGGIGYTKELPIERMYRKVRLLRIADGASEIQRMIIARNLLRG